MQHVNIQLQPMSSINNKAPVNVEKSILIDAPVKVVWKIIADINNWSEWNPDIKQSKLNGDLTVGTTFYWKSNGSKITSTIHTVDSYNNFGWSGKAFGAFSIYNWKLTEVNDKTEVWVEESMEGVLMWMFRGFMQNTLENVMTNWLYYLKEEAEK